MSTVPTQIRIEENLKRQATILFDQLGLDMSGAVNLFLRQCVLRGGLPFDVQLPNYKPELLEAFKEAIELSNTSGVKSYSSFADAVKDIND